MLINSLAMKSLSNGNMKLLFFFSFNEIGSQSILKSILSCAFHIRDQLRLLEKLPMKIQFFMAIPQFNRFQLNYLPKVVIISIYMELIHSAFPLLSIIIHIG